MAAITVKTDFTWEVMMLSLGKFRKENAAALRDDGARELAMFKLGTLQHVEDAICSPVHSRSLARAPSSLLNLSIVIAMTVHHC
jgi:hypothetical protein